LLRLIGRVIVVFFFYLLADDLQFILNLNVWLRNNYIIGVSKINVSLAQ